MSHDGVFARSEALFEGEFTEGDLAYAGSAKKPERSMKIRRIERMRDGFDCDNSVIFKPVRATSLIYALEGGQRGSW
jgi:hypothetical protein